MKKLLLTTTLLLPIMSFAIDYEAKYRETLTDINEVTTKIIATQNSNLWLSFYNTELAPLQNLVNAYIQLKNHNYSTDAHPNWIHQDYTDLMGQTTILYGMNSALVKVRDHNAYNYRALITYTNNQVDDVVTRDFNQFVRVNGKRLINQ